jgi:DNA gyrase subunit A
MGRSARGVHAIAGGQKKLLESGTTFVGLVRVPKGVAQQLAAAAAAPAESDGEGSDADVGGAGGGGFDSDSEETLALRRAAGPWVLFVTQQGMAKRVTASAFGVYSRGTSGRIGCKFREGDRLAAIRLIPGDLGEASPPAPPATGFGAAAAKAAAAAAAAARGGAPPKDGLSDEVVIASEAGVINRCRVRDVAVYGPYAKGNRLMRLDAGDTVKGLCLVDAGAQQQ